MNYSFHKQVFKPNARFEYNTLLSFFQAIKTQIDRRDLIYQLFRKSLFANYKKSFLGSIWILLTPLTGMLSWLFLHRAQVLQPGDVGVPYAAYILVGTLLWGFFIRITSAFMNALTNFKFLLTGTNLPHEVIFGTTILLKLVDFFISFFITIVILILFRLELSWGIFFFPFVLLPLLFFAIGIGLLVSVFSVISYDIKKIVTAILGLIMFVTPIIYSSKAITNILLRKIIQFNPLTYLVCSARDIILFGTLYSIQGYIVCSVISCILLFITWRTFYLTENVIIERII